MTEIDPTPYLLPTDLVTAEDGLRYIESFPPHMPVCEVGAEYEARLDRERRQACRRGCFTMFREACRERTRERCPPVHPPRYGGWSLASSAYREHRLHYLRRALAFRAAARAK